MSEALVRQPMQLPSMTDLGTLLAKSGYFQDARDMSQAVVKILAGQELGFGPIASMTGVNIIKGKVALSANLMAAAIKRSGRYNYRVKKLTETECEIHFYEGQEMVGPSSFTIADAKKAGLSGVNWSAYPKNMLFARALSNGAKWYCPDLSGGPLYTPDELGSVVDGETGEMVHETPKDVTPPPDPPKDVTTPSKAPIPTVDEWAQQFSQCAGQSSLKSAWNVYYEIRDQYNGEEQTAIMRAKDKRKVELSEAKP
jgi:hypothetical protein